VAAQNDSALTHIDETPFFCDQGSAFRPKLIAKDAT
jgi:hypothetical protein